jgi:zinc transport system substrate-binding protein
MVLNSRVSARVWVLGALVVAVVAGATTGAAASSQRSVVANFYPIAYAALRVGGDRVHVTNLTPAGAEPHDLELTPDQIDEILDADVVFDLGHGFQPAVEKAAEQRDGPTVSLLRAGTKDPHIWLDPVRMEHIVRRVQAELTRLDPKGGAVYERNAQRFLAQLDALDARYAQELAHCARTVIVTGHEAFGYLAARYGLRQEGVAGLSPDAEPDARRLGQLADLVKRLGVTVVFTEDLVSPRIADTLAREAGVKTETLNPLEGLTDRELAKGATYLTVMDQNLAKLRSALGCSSAG